MMRRWFVALLLALPSLAFAGYSGQGYCYGTLGEAVTKVAYAWTGQCANGSCRLLSYVPVTGAAQVIVGGKIETFTIMACESAPVALESGLTATPFYASDSGTVSACGSSVSGAGGVSGGGAATTSELARMCPEGPLTAACLEYVGITGPSLTTVLLSVFGLVMGFWVMGYTYGLVEKSIQRA